MPKTKRERQRTKGENEIAGDSLAQGKQKSQTETQKKIGNEGVPWKAGQAWNETEVVAALVGGWQR